MTRVRISTTVDAERLRRCRLLVPKPDSQLIDQALGALVANVEAQQELEALDAQPYEADPELTWTAPPGPDLAYDGDVPPDVLELAEARHRPAQLVTKGNR